MVIAQAMTGIPMKITNPLMDKRQMMQGTSSAISTISALKAMSVMADCLMLHR